MNAEIAYQLAKARHADLLREADEFRRAAAARSGRRAAAEARTTSLLARMLRRESGRRSPVYR